MLLMSLSDLTTPDSGVYTLCSFFPSDLARARPSDGQVTGSDWLLCYFDHFGSLANARMYAHRHTQADRQTHAATHILAKRRECYRPTVLPPDGHFP